MGKILVIGKGGQLGQSIHAIKKMGLLEGNLTFVGRKELDLSSVTAIDQFFEGKVYDVIINCAAYTAVDKAEQEQVLAARINHHAVKRLAQIAKERDAYFVHVSTDYVFDGTSYCPYVESDLVNPLNVYGHTKLLGEQAVLEINPRGTIIRASWVYSEFGNNFVKTMLRLAKEQKQLGIIFDQVGTPTYAGDLAKTILVLVEQYLAGKDKSQMQVYHFSNEGVCSWYDFAKAIFELSSITINVSPIETVAYPAPAKRPFYSVLNKAKIKAELDMTIPYWKDSLALCLKKLQEQN